MMRRLVISLSVVWVLLANGQVSVGQNQPNDDNAMLISLRDYGSEDVGYLVIPEKRPKAGLVIAPDSWGLTSSVCKVCRELADLGYIVLAVDLYNGERAQTQEGAQILEQWVELGTSVKAVQTGIQFFKSSPRFRMDKVLVIGARGSVDVVINAVKDQEIVAGITLFYPKQNFDLKSLRQVNAPIQVVGNNVPEIQARMKEVDKSLLKDIKFQPVAEDYQKVWLLSSSPHSWSNSWKEAFSFWLKCLQNTKKDSLLDKVFG
ncbi:MAG: dienelactone hydrolase family protein [Verrucomicrobiota bacterium]